MFSEGQYDRFKDYINALPRQFAFSDWFPEERIYLPFRIELHSDIYDNIQKILGFFKGGVAGFPLSPGYEIADYKLGLTRPKNNLKKQFKINKVLAAMGQQDEAEFLVSLKAGEISEYKYKAKIVLSRENYSNIRKEFENDPLRLKKDDFYVVISANRHDLASMSTDKGWTSCMNLASKDGKNKDVYCEVKNGGFVAYLIHAQDKNIEKPIARIHIRRFDNRSGKSIAIPEDVIYGQNLPDFMAKVNEWLTSKQGKIKPGRYIRRGGEYSDSFPSKKKFFPFNPEDKELIKKYIYKWFRSEEKGKYLDYFTNSLGAILKSQGKWDSKLVKTLIDFIFKPSIIPNRMQQQSTEIFMASLALRFPEYIDKDKFDKAIIAANSEQQQDLLDRFPNFVDKDTLKHFKKKQTAILPIAFADHMKDLVAQEITSKLDVNNKALHPNAEKSVYRIAEEVAELLDQAKIFNPIPPLLVGKIINFANNLDKINYNEIKVDDVKTFKTNIILQIIHIFTMTDTDIPIVIEFYKSLLPHWRELGGIRTFGFALKSLKENGKEFIPFLEEKLKQLEAMNNVNQLDKERTIDAYKYVIDSMMSNGVSSKHEFFSSGVYIDV